MATRSCARRLAAVGADAAGRSLHRRASGLGGGPLTVRGTRVRAPDDGSLTLMPRSSASTTHSVAETLLLSQPYGLRVVTVVVIRAAVRTAGSSTHSRSSTSAPPLRSRQARGARKRKRRHRIAIRIFSNQKRSEFPIGERLLPYIFCNPLRTAMVEVWRCASANASGVLPSASSASSASPASTSTRHAASLAQSAAQCSAVWPAVSLRFGLAPALMIARQSASEPPLEAACSGVAPRFVRAVTLAPDWKALATAARQVTHSVDMFSDTFQYA